MRTWWANLRWRVGYRIGGFTYAYRGEAGDALFPPEGDRL